MSDQFLVGDVRTIAIPSPAAGNDFSYTVPAGVRLKVHAINFEYATDATVTHRVATIFVDDKGLTTFVQIAQQLQTENLNYHYTFAFGNTSTTLVYNQFVPVPLAAYMILKPGDILYSSMVNLQAGDEFVSIQLNVESFLLP